MLFNYRTRWQRWALLGSCAAALGASAFTTPEPALVQQILGKLTGFYQATAPEKSYLHLDKGFYTAGELVWFKAYVVNAGQHQPDTLSRVLYVDLVGPNQQVVARRTLRLQGGTAAGDLALPDSAAQGSYTVRAYTNWMRNAGPDYFFSQSLPVLGTKPAPAAKRKPAANKPDFQLFPEGGQLIAGLPNVLAFKASDQQSRGLAVKGELLNAAGTPVASFASLHAGMGAFTFTPEAGQAYTAHVTWPDGSTSTHAVPAAAPAGGLLLHVEPSVTQMGIRMARKVPGEAVPSENVTLVVHVRGQLVYVGQSALANGEVLSSRIPIERFPSGIAHFTLFDAQGVARCERLAFVNRQDGLRVTVRPDKASYGPRQKVTLALETRDASGQPVPAELSLAVTAADLEQPGAPTIVSHLLLSSDLRGYIEDPAYYFRDAEPATRQALDHLMLTQGWRRFVWAQLLNNPLPVGEYALERGLGLSGQVWRTERKPAAQSELTLLIGKGLNNLTTSTTDNQGRFLFTGFGGQDSARVVVQARTPKGSPALIVKLTDRWAGVPAPYPPALMPDAALAASFGQRSRRQQSIERQFGPDTTRRIMLSNVVIKGRREPVPDDPRRIFTGADVMLKTSSIPGFDNYPNALMALQGRIAGVQIMGNGMQTTVQIRGAGSIMGSSQPLILLDGMPVRDIEAILTIPASDIESVDVFKGASAAMFGTQGANGVMAFYTKRGGSASTSSGSSPGVARATVPAYYQPREFYAPRYETPAPALHPDYRATTLYWAPTVATNADGRATLTFYTSDDLGAFRVGVQGLSANGRPGTGSAVLEVQRGR
ncbi:TonB-dependent receptor plug domain-containing protein [Hymenobacter latericus]|uniref:TonB-dependent receptor plug domain-containing protein n=1 Tax=Hymenobacter sp. YIM 151858-1 TaxID=2987688 RepID=UPI002227CF10|nr:TonB-dependent receptor plug domain-containing protein [Hymenobacter sp. YIM 151858-1]UYZ57871.1 TonB-dependent receptor plug domain-containing protein [Hymenobacter sp. YIM 151858-1]